MKHLYKLYVILKQKLIARYFSAALIFTLISSLALQAKAIDNNTSIKEPLKVGFVIDGPVADYGYNYAHNLGRLYLQSHLSNVQTIVAENIPENAEAERIMEKMIAQGSRLIFLTSYGYLEPAERVAKRHPEIVFMQCWRNSTQNNIGTYGAYQFESLYVVGVVAGRVTTKNHIGLVATQPTPQIINDINAFTMGVHSVNPKCKINVIWTNSWSDASVEAEAAKALIDSGVDLLGCFGNNLLTVAQIAEKNHILVFGINADVHELAPQEWLTGSQWNWGGIYTNTAKSVQAGTWKKDCCWLGMKDDAVSLCSFGKSVPQSVRTEAQSIVQKIKNGKLIIFKGPLKDREGKLRLSAGQTADAKWLSETNFFISGVEGNFPK